MVKVLSSVTVVPISSVTVNKSEELGGVFVVVCDVVVVVVVDVVDVFVVEVVVVVVEDVVAVVVEVDVVGVVGGNLVVVVTVVVVAVVVVEVVDDVVAFEGTSTSSGISLSRISSAISSFSSSEPP